MSQIENILWVVLHPVEAVRTKSRQIEVTIEHAQSPVRSTMEDFPQLPIRKAARLLKRQSSGVPLEAWPMRDQELMKKGRLPVLGDHPEHINI